MQSSLKKSGYLVKEGGRVRSWKKRWFVLENCCLRYYKDKTDSKVQGEIKVETATQVMIAERSKKPCLSILTPARCYYMTLAGSGSGGGGSAGEDSLEAWQSVLMAAMGEMRSATGASNKQAPPTPGRVGLADFQLLRLIGKGNFGRVNLVQMKGGQFFAMKVLSKSHIIESHEIEHTMAECSILQKMKHPFLVNLHYSFQTLENLYLILDFVNGGELLFHLQNDKKFSEERVRFYAAEILLGLEHLHNASIIYRDLKLENILLDRYGHIVLTDFGLSKWGMSGDDARTHTFCGTPEYMAPDMLTQRKTGYGKEIDWWSFGSVIYELLTGLPPFYSQEVQEMYRRILTEPLTFPGYVNPVTQDFISKLLAKNPQERLSDPNVMKQHKYFDGLNWDDVYNKRVTPPFLPNVKSDEDTTNVDPMFTEEEVTGEDVPQGQQKDAGKSPFDGFTFVADK
eukprot:TRINITY_DN355_c3_g1_i1.p1 TRINITY_DN355_c3_g1~~TRINITY_DN355_c3_g1_i1.p1  ORF type:complete len:482 (-),score=142.11 TRINITY_DN355_c3_g1_i1:83-1447(-)